MYWYIVYVKLYRSIFIVFKIILLCYSRMKINIITIISYYCKMVLWKHVKKSRIVLLLLNMCDLSRMRDFLLLLLLSRTKVLFYSGWNFILFDAALYIYRDFISLLIYYSFKDMREEYFIFFYESVSYSSLVVA